MSDIEEFEIVEPPAVPEPKKDPAAVALASARLKLTNFLGRAVEIITELAETSENDRVRLAAAESIADRVGLSKSSVVQVQATDTEHDVATYETTELLKRIEANQQGIGVPTHEIALDVLIVHEGEIDESEEVLAPS